MQAGAILSTVGFICSSVLVLFRPRLGYMVGLTAGLIAVAWLFWTEFLLHGGANSWIALNIVYTE